VDMVSLREINAWVNARVKMNTKTQQQEVMPMK